MRVFVLVASVAALAACASRPLMDEASCLSADWASYGYQDGVAGGGPALANRRAAACQPFGVQMDHAAYYEGRDRGLTSFCTVSRAYRMGASGEEYRGQCAGLNEAAFAAEWERGWTLYGFTSAVDIARANLFDVRAARDVARQEISALAAGGYADLPPPEIARRTAALIQTERQLTDVAIPEATYELERAERALEEYLAWQDGVPVG